ncbi:MAG: glycosyltransferase family 2 protein [Nitrospirota bacterium]
MGEQTDVTISIVTYNSHPVIRECISSVLEQAQGPEIEIIVVDNASSDGTAALVKSSFPGIRLIENSTNLGFGTAHNQAFRISRGRHFLILNPDTLVYPGTVSELVRFMDSTGDAGVVGCKIFWDEEKRFMFPDLRIHTLGTAILHFTQFCRFFPGSRLAKRYWETAYRIWDAETPVAVDGISGGLMMVRREVFASAGCFDEEFFLFFEEHDLLRRIRKSGWGVYYLPGAAIRHFYEESFRNSTVDTGAVYLKSALTYYRKYYGVAGVLFVHTLRLADRFIRHLEQVVLKKQERYAVVVPSEGRLTFSWPSHKNAVRYLAEISYSPLFHDRGGMYVEGETLSLSSRILDHLPGKTGYIRILPVTRDHAAGPPWKIVRIAA